MNRTITAIMVLICTFTVLHADEYVPIPLIWPRTPALDASFFFIDYTHVTNQRYGLRFYSYVNAPFIPKGWRKFVKFTLQGNLNIDSNFDQYNAFYKTQKKRFNQMARDMEYIRTAISLLQQEMQDAGNSADSDKAREIEEQLQPLEVMLQELEDNPATVIDFDFYYQFDENLQVLEESDVWDEIEAEYDISGTTENIRNYAGGITDNLTAVSHDLRTLNLDPFYARAGWRLQFMVHYFYGRVPRGKFPERMLRWGDWLRARLGHADEPPIPNTSSQQL